MAMVCSGCRAEAPEGRKFCGECGAALPPLPESASAAAAVPGGDGAFYCTKHTKAMTRLRCGRCESPICSKCTIYTPAGTRCRACAKNKVPLRAAGVLHSAAGAVSGLAPAAGRQVWYMALWYLILGFLRGPFE